jgi:hypothetical protein
MKGKGKRSRTSPCTGEDQDSEAIVRKATLELLEARLRVGCEGEQREIEAKQPLRTFRSKLT